MAGNLRPNHRANPSPEMGLIGTWLDTSLLHDKPFPSVPLQTTICVTTI